MIFSVHFIYGLINKVPLGHILQFLDTVHPQRKQEIKVMLCSCTITPNFKGPQNTTPRRKHEIIDVLKIQCI